MAEERLSRARFIRLGAALGVGAASASVLAGCGGGGSSGGAQGGETTGSGEPQAAGNQPGGETADVAGSGGTTAAEARGGTAIAREADVAPGSAKDFTDAQSGQPAVLVHLQNGKFVAYSAVCTHQGCTVDYQKGNLACPCHGSIFDPANGGAVVNPPANRPLPEIPVEVRGGQVFRA